MRVYGPVRLTRLSFTVDSSEIFHLPSAARLAARVFPSSLFVSITTMTMGGT